jgi:type I restriction enzyme, S subunit
MSFNFPTERLDKIVKRVCVGFVGSCNKDYTDKEHGVPMIRTTNLTGHQIDFSDVKYISHEFHKNNKKSQLSLGDILVARHGDSGLPSIVTSELEMNCLNVVIIKPYSNDNLVDNYFILYALKCPFVVQQIKSAVGGSVQGVVNTKAIAELQIPYPNRKIREKLVYNLLNIDQKIILNTQTNQTLEEMAQAIFKSWFVDFEPVKAKMNGEQPEGMDAATASLFPEKLDSETGIPVGWSQGVIADIAKLNAKSWTKKNQPEQVHYVDLANTKNGVIETVTTYDFDEAPSRARRVLNSGDTIVGTVRPGNRSFAFIGETEQPLTGSTGFAVLSPKEEFWTSFVYLATTNDGSIDEYARLADGGAYPAIKPVVVADTPCVIPTTDIAQKFWQLTGAMLKKAHQNRLENEELAKLRDTLLPKLLSGEIELGSVATE